MKQDWTEQLRHAMEGYEEPAPEGLWEAVEVSLEQHSATGAEVQPAARRSARVVALRRWLGAAAVAATLAGGSLTYYLLHDDSPAAPAPQLARQPAVVQQPHGVLSGADSAQYQSDVAQHQPDVAQHQPNVAPVYARAAQPAQGHALAVVAREDSGEPQAGSTLGLLLQQSDELRNEPAVTTPAAEAEDAVPPAQPTPATVVRQQPQPPSLPHGRSSERQRRPSPPSLTATLHGSNLLAANSGSGTTTTEPLRLVRSYMAAPVYTNNAELFDSEPFYMTDALDEAHHHMPFSLGLTVTMPLGPHLWVESGLTYTSVSSDFTVRLMRRAVSHEQTLRYVGVPLSVGWQFWSYRSLSAYLSAGAEADFCVQAQAESDGQRVELQKDRAQFSLTGHGGVEYRLLPHVGVYAEPGVRYYMDNGSRLQNIFKDKPCLFDLQVGLRYRLK